VLHREGGEIAVDLWNANSPTPNWSGGARGAARRAEAGAAASAGVAPEVLAGSRRSRPRVRVLSPKAREGGGEVSLRDRLPAIVGFALGLVLWSAVLTGASILLNSVMEEKSNRVLEILAASATTLELMGGKILGVAALALTLLGVWGALGFASLITGAPGPGRGPELGADRARASCSTSRCTRCWAT
jgi:ABC-2 type transport system permease protein